jgi:hypothetical protein
MSGIHYHRVSTVEAWIEMAIYMKDVIQVGCVMGPHGYPSTLLESPGGDPIPITCYVL